MHETDWYQWESRCDSCSHESADDGPAFFDHEDDLDAARAMGQSSIRLGIDWSRLFPNEASFPGSPVADEVARYHAIFAAARERDLQVMVTLVHFALPLDPRSRRPRERARVGATSTPRASTPRSPTSAGPSTRPGFAR